VTTFESKILGWIIQNCDDDAVKHQLQSASVSDRRNTGVGCYSEIEIVDGVDATNADYGQRGPLSGPKFESTILQHGGGTLLWFENGYAKTLEIFTYEENFPSDHDELGEFELS
jgi:hypothetical protein